MATNVGTLQSKLVLDFSQFASGMNSAISMVRSFGNQLQKALGSNATQGFSTTNQAINDIKTSITNLQAVASNFQATMQNLNTTLAQFSNLQANTSRMGQDLNQAANSARNVGKGAQTAATQLARVSNSSKSTAQNSQNAASQINNVSANSKKAAQNAKKLSDNINEARKFAENLKRILGGIIISQAFYKLLGVMQDLVSSSVQFMQNMEQSAIAFKYLLGSADNSAGFLQALQDFAVSSPMDMQGAESAARMLMTMGFEAESTISVLRVLTDAATVAGGEMSDTVYRIALALGQMLQSGTVKMQELRQLVNANIPIFDILQEELGLTAEQISHIGDASIDSGKAVTGILIGLSKKFGGASYEMQTTITGALSAARDSFYILFNEVMAGPYEAFRKKLVQLSNAMQYLAQVARQYGAGGVFEAIVPERLHGVVRNVIGAFMQLGKTITFLGRIASEIFSGMGEIITYVLNVILPPISILVNAIAQFVYGLLKAYPIIKYFFAALTLLAVAKHIGAIFLWFWKVLGLGKIIMSIVGYIQSMIKALMFLGSVIVAHPVIAAIVAITIAVLALTGVFQKAINKVKEFFSMITSANKTVNKKMNIGYDPNEILQPTDKETNDNADKYKSSLEEIASKLEDVGDEANKTKNKLKNAFNQSFDEVYAINPNTSSDLGLDSLENLDLSLSLDELGKFNDALGTLGEFDLGAWSDGFMEAWNEMMEKIKQFLEQYGLGAALTGILAGVITKNPWVALAAALAALFWPTIAEELNATKEEGEQILGGVIGALLGGVIASILGTNLLFSAIWVGAGALIFSGLWPAIQSYMDGEGWQVSLQSLNYTNFGAGIGALIGTAIGGPLIGALSGLIGALIGTAIQDGMEAWANDESGWQIADSVNWTHAGMALGTAIGFAVGGPMAAAIGLVLGTLIGSIIENILKLFGAVDGDWDVLAGAFKIWGQDIGKAFVDGLLGEGGIFGWSTQLFDWAGDAFKMVKDAWEKEDWGAVGGYIIEGILFGIAGAITWIFEPISRIFRAIVQALCALFGINSPAKEMEPYGEFILLGVLEGIVGAITSIPGYIAEAGQALMDAIGGWFTDIGSKVTDWFGNGVAAIETFVTNTSTSVKGWVTDRVADFTSFKSKASENISTWVSDTKTKVSTWATDTASSISTWTTNRVNDFNTFKAQAGETISSWVSTAKSNILNFASNTKATVSDWWTNVKLKFDSFKGTSFTNWCTSTFNIISNWCTDVWTSIKDKIGNAIEKIKEFLGLSGTNANISVNANLSGSGHANGGVFNREHWARFAEGNKAEAIIPLENATAMQPFVDAVSNGLTSSLAPILSNMNSNGGNNLQPLYVGTLIADDQGLKELERKMQIIRIKEERRS